MLHDCVLILKIYLIHENYNTMLQRRFLLLMLMLIACISTISCISLLRYFDPYLNIPLGLSLLWISIFLSITSVVSVVLYFCKKIYFRWEVYIYNVMSSIRQASFISIYILSIVMFAFLWLSVVIPIIVVFFMFLFLELFIRSIN